MRLAMFSRRRFLSLCCTSPLAAAYTRAEAIDTDCLQPLPADLTQHELVAAAFDGLDRTQLWDAHVHLVGSGDSGGGAYLNPDSLSMWSPVEYMRRKVMMAAACVDDAQPGEFDRRYVERLRVLLDAMPPGFKMLLFAFDCAVDDDGVARPERSTFCTPNAYAAAVAARFSDRFEWAASIHPYRADALARLEWAAAAGARAVKWLPSSMNIDPAAPRCDAFYERLSQLGLPLIVHCGEELAAPGARRPAFNNPLRVRRPLEHGVRVVVAHAASLGEARDLDAGGEDGPRVPSFELFTRLMRTPQYEGRLFGDIAAVFQRNRALEIQRDLITRAEWHGRLLHGSDYPLPGIGLVYTLDAFVSAGWLDAGDADTLTRIRRHNPLLFEFVLKRTLAVDGKRLSAQVFQTRPFFAPLT